MSSLSPFLQPSFSAGEISPFAHGRTDLAAYFLGVELSKNFVLTPQGSLHKRPGFRFLKQARDTANPSRLLPFVASNLDAYMLEVSAGFTRYYNADGSQIGGPLQTTNPFSVSDLPNLRTAQSADVLYIFSGTNPIHQITRNSPTSFSASTFPTNTNGPYLEANTTATTLTPAANTGSGVLLSASTGIFTANDVGRLVRLRRGAGNWGYAIIVSFVLSTSVTIDIIENFAGAGATTDWQLGLYSDFLGWPSTGAFHADRLWLGGPSSQPFRLNASNSGDYTNFSPSAANGTVTDQNSIQLLLQAGRAQTIQWLQSSSEGLVVGMSDAEVVVRSASTVDPISPTSVEFLFNTYRGSVGVDSVRVDRSLLFTQRDGRTIRELVYSEDLGSFQTLDLSIRAEHIFQSSPVSRIDYQQAPASITWALKSDGTLAGLTFEKDQQVFGWHTHETREGDAIEDIAVLPANEDTLWALVRREINGSTVRYVEKLDPLFRSQTPQEDAFFLDSGLTLTSGSPTTSWSGLSHLEGETVSVLADGAAHPDVVVSGGAITTQVQASKIQVGLPYSSEIIPLPYESSGFPSSGRTRRTHQVHLYLLSSLGGEVGSINFSTRFPILYRQTSDLMGSPVPLFTGWKDVVIRDRASEQTRISILHDQPFPFILLALRIDTAMGET